MVLVFDNLNDQMSFWSLKIMSINILSNNKNICSEEQKQETEKSALYLSSTNPNSPRHPLCYRPYSSAKPAPLRLESDCVKNEGFNMKFGDEGCIPPGSHFAKSQRLLCMASWMQDGNGFAMLRKENERAFYCARINFTANNEVSCEH